MLERFHRAVAFHRKAKRTEADSEQFLEGGAAEFEAVAERLCAEHDHILFDVRFVGAGRNRLASLFVGLVFLEEAVVFEDIADKGCAAER